MPPRYLARGLFGDAEAAREQRLGEVEAVERGDVLLVGERHRFLRLHDFDIVRRRRRRTGRAPASAAAPPVARLRRDLQLFLGRLQIEKRRAHFVVDRRLAGPRPRRGGCAASRRLRAAARCAPPWKIGTVTAPVTA